MYQWPCCSDEPPLSQVFGKGFFAALSVGAGTLVHSPRSLSGSCHPVPPTSPDRAWGVLDIQHSLLTINNHSSKTTIFPYCADLSCKGDWASICPKLAESAYPSLPATPIEFIGPLKAYSSLRSENCCSRYCMSSRQSLFLLSDSSSSSGEGF